MPLSQGIWGVPFRSLDTFYFGGPGGPGSSQQDLVCSGRAMLIYDAVRKARKTIDKEKIVKGHPRRATPDRLQV